MHGLAIASDGAADLGGAECVRQAVADEMCAEIIGEATVVLERGGQAADGLAGLEDQRRNAAALEIERGRETGDAGADDRYGLCDLGPESRTPAV